MEANSQRHLSLDTNVLFDLAAGNEVAHDFRESYQARGYSLLIVASVTAELAFLRVRGSPRQQMLADTALRERGKWRLTPRATPPLAQVICKRFALGLIERGLLPDNEFNDAMILAETAYWEIPVLVTADRHLLDLDRHPLRLRFDDADLAPVIVFHPREMLRAIR